MEKHKSTVRDQPLFIMFYNLHLRSGNEIEKWKEKQEQMKNDYKKHDLRRQKTEEILNSAAPEEKQALAEKARAELLEQSSKPIFIDEFVINQKIIEMINRENLACK